MKGVELCGRIRYRRAALGHELMEARDEKRLLRLQRQLAGADA